MNRINLYSHQRQSTRRLIKNTHRKDLQHDPWLVLSMAAFNSKGRLMPVHSTISRSSKMQVRLKIKSPPNER